VHESHLDVWHLVLLLVTAPLVAVAVVLALPKVWRMPPDRPTRPRRWKLYVAMRMFAIRYLPLNIVSALFLELWGVAYFFDKLLAGGPGSVAGTLAMGCGWAFVASLALTPSVALLNRPRFAVPPGYRNMRGPLELWWLSRQRPVSEYRTGDA
jgi:hypothetical protein